MATLTTTGDLTEAGCLHGRRYQLETLGDDGWSPAGELVLFPNCGFLNRGKLRHIVYHGPTHSVAYSFGKGADHRSGRLHFTADGAAFVGSAILDAGGQPQAVRGAADSRLVYKTWRKESTGGPEAAWDELKIENKWEDGILRSYYYLGDRDVSDRTAVTKVDKKNWNTTIEMVPTIANPFGDRDAFAVVVTNLTFAFVGTYTAEDGTPYDWRGELVEPAAGRADPAAFADVDGGGPPGFTPPSEFSADRRAADPTGPSLSPQDLDGVTSIFLQETNKGTEVLVDVADTQAGKYLNFCAINALDDKWIDKIFGKRYELTPNVRAIYDANHDYFKGRSVLVTGQMIYDGLAGAPEYKKAIDRIKPAALTAGWQDLGKNPKLAPTFSAVTQAIYIEGYRDKVPGIQPYLQDDPKKWAKEYFDFLTDEKRIAIWQTQVASGQFDNVKQRMYEWYVKLQVLDPKADYGERMLATAYSALVGVAYTNVVWSDDIKPFLEKVLQDARDGKIDTGDPVVDKAAEEYRDVLEKMIDLFDNIEEFGGELLNAITAWANKNPKVPMVKAGVTTYGTFEQALKDPVKQSKWKALGTKASNVLGMLFYGAAAGYLIYQIVSSGGENPITPGEVIQGISLGVVALGLLVKTIQKVFAMGAGRWLLAKSFNINGFLGDVAGSLAFWFKEGGQVVPTGKLGKVFVTIFGDNYAKFFSRRLGPALAVLGIGLSAYNLYRAVVTGDVPNIIFEAIGAFFALAEAALIGLSLMSVGWAGPVGLAVAVVGIIVLLVQLIWNLLHPPEPPSTPIDDFVEQEMKPLGYAS